MQYFAHSYFQSFDPGLLPEIVKETILTSYLQTVAAVALIYDAILTMDREVKYFWRVPRRPVEFAYFANRYIGILGAVSNFPFDLFSADIIICNFDVWTGNISHWCTVVLIDYVLMIRVLALYSRGRTLALCLYLLLALEAAAKLTTVTYGIIYQRVDITGATGVTLCGQDRYLPLWIGIVDWSGPLIYAIILMALALYKAAEYWRISAGFKGSTLVKVLIEDQVIYFMLVILVFAFAMLQFMLSTTNAFASDVLEVLGNQSFLCILGSRMLLNLKEAGERGQNEGTSFVPPSRTVSDIEFGVAPANVEASQTEEAAEHSQNEGTSFVAPSGIVDDIEFGAPAANIEVRLTSYASRSEISNEQQLANQTEAAIGE